MASRRSSGALNSPRKVPSPPEPPELKKIYLYVLFRRSTIGPSKTWAKTCHSALINSLFWRRSKRPVKGEFRVDPVVSDLPEEDDTSSSRPQMYTERQQMGKELWTKT